MAIVRLYITLKNTCEIQTRRLDPVFDPSKNPNRPRTGLHSSTTPVQTWQSNWKKLAKSNSSCMFQRCTNRKQYWCKNAEAPPSELRLTNVGHHAIVTYRSPSIEDLCIARLHTTCKRAAHRDPSASSFLQSRCHRFIYAKNTTIPGSSSWEKKWLRWKRWKLKMQIRNEVSVKAHKHGKNMSKPFYLCISYRSMTIFLAELQHTKRN